MAFHVLVADVGPLALNDGLEAVVHGDDAGLLFGTHLFGVAFARHVRGLELTRTEDFELQADLLVVLGVGLVHHDDPYRPDVSRRAGIDMVCLAESVDGTGGHQVLGIGHRRDGEHGHLVGELRRAEHGATGRRDVESDTLHGRVRQGLVDLLGDFLHVGAPGHLLELGQADTHHTLRADDRRAVRGHVGLGDRVEEHVDDALDHAVLLGVLDVVGGFDGVAEHRLAAAQG